MWEGAGLEGQVLVAVGFFTLQLEAFFSPRNAWLPFSYCFALIVSWMFWPAVKVPNCGALPCNFEAPWKQRANMESSCGNMKLQTSSWTEWMQLMQNWGGQVAASRLEPAEAAVWEICSRRNPICCLSLLVADTRKWNLCHCSSFYASIWSPKSRLQKAAWKPEDAKDIPRDLLFWPSN